MKGSGIWRQVVCLITMLGMSVTLSAAVGSKLKGTPIGSPNVDYSTGMSSETVNTLACAFDGNPDTYYASLDRSNTWVGLDLGTPHIITRVGWVSRTSQPKRVQLGLFEGANRPDFLDAVPLYLIPQAGANHKHFYADVNVSRGFRYVRYVGPNDARCNIGEVEFYGQEGVGDNTRFYQVTNLPTLIMHTVDGYDPKDKVNQMPSYMALIYDRGTRIQEDTMLLRGRGNASWGFPKKPYRIKFYDGKSKRLLMGTPQESPAKAKKWTLINNYGDKTLMRNIVAFELSRRLGLAYTPYCQPVDVILNGEYKGCYQLCDQITVDKNRVAIAKLTPDDNTEPTVSGGYLVEVDAYASQETSWFSSAHGIPVTIKSPGDDDITMQQKSYVKRAFNLLEGALWSSSFKDEKVGYRSKLDVESFLRHFIVGELSGNTDTYWSTYMYKNREQVPFYVGPVWDFDLAMDNDVRIYPVSNRTDWVYRSGGSAAAGMVSFVNRVLQDPYAAARLRMIWAEMRRSGAFSEESLTAYIDSTAQVLDASQRLNFTRWPILNSIVHQNPVALGSYDAEVNVLHNFFHDRLKWIDNFLGYANGKLYTDSVFHIKSATDLVEFAVAVNSGANRSEAYLANDINMSGFSGDFRCIGTAQHPFQGIFDGRGHTISNLNIVGNDNCGLFGTVSDGVQIRDFVFDSSCSIKGGSYVGLVGVTKPGGQVTIERVGNEAPVTGSGRNVSAILGCNMSNGCQIIMRDCYNTGNISGGFESGALSGWLGNNAQVSGCWNTGQVTGCDDGREVLRYGSTINITNCYSTFGTQLPQVTDEAVRSGELCYKLNQPKGDKPLWFQRLGEDAHPVFDISHGKVLRNDDGTYSNEKVLMGDVQKDDLLTLTDADWEAEHIVGRTPAGFFSDNADVNYDGAVNVLDVVGIIGGIGGETIHFQPDNEGKARMYSSNSSIKSGSTRKLNVWMSAPRGITACQADIILNGALAVDTQNVNLGNMFSDTHVLKRGMQQDNVRVLAYSTANNSFKTLNGTFISFILQAEEGFTGGTVTLANQVLTTANGTTYHPADVTYNVSLAKTYVTSIALSESSLGLVVDDVHRLGVSVLPATATNPKLSWKSSSDAVATVDEYGTVTARSVGTATITAKATDGSGVQASVQVTVVDGTGVMAIESIPATAEIYSLTGMRVLKPSRGGIYIIGGTKVLVR